MPVYVSLTSRVAVSFGVWLVVILSPYRTDHDDGRITELCEHLREPNSHQVQNSSEGVAPRRTRVFQMPVSGETILKNTEQRQAFSTAARGLATPSAPSDTRQPLFSDFLPAPSQPDASSSRLRPGRACAD